MRINKYLASGGYATRTDADRLIREGLVAINGRPAVIGQKVNENDVVDVRFKHRQYQYIAYNKPRGIITHSPRSGEKDIQKSVPIAGIFPVGRLDKRSHGLIILTDDARITDKLLNPDYAHEKTYRVTTAEKLPPHFKRRMEAGVDIEGYTTRRCRVNILGEKKFAITLTEGKKHQIRRMCAALSLAALDLERVQIMNIRLGNLKQGEYRPIRGSELAEFLQSLGLRAG